MSYVSIAAIAHLKWALQVGVQLERWQAAMPEGASDLHLRVGQVDYDHLCTLALSHTRETLQARMTAFLMGVPVALDTRFTSPGRVEVCYRDTLPPLPEPNR